MSIDVSGLVSMCHLSALQRVLIIETSSHSKVVLYAKLSQNERHEFIFERPLPASRWGS